MNRKSKIEIQGKVYQVPRAGSNIYKYLYDVIETPLMDLPEEYFGTEVECQSDMVIEEIND